ncbi:MAG: hypothetical protein KGH60_00370 [Candidatus Micrarchaeota archaeon]|nr:hypothetical protein [Candidatus Micrarchaeota archaeon]
MGRRLAKTAGKQNGYNYERTYSPVAQDLDFHVAKSLIVGLALALSKDVESDRVHYWSLRTRLAYP